MSNLASVGNVLVRLVCYLVFMTLLLGAIGSGFGGVEVSLWLAALVGGVCLIVAQHRKARRQAQSHAVARLQTTD